MLPILLCDAASQGVVTCREWRFRLKRTANVSQAPLPSTPNAHVASGRPPSPFPSIRPIGFLQPFDWLRAGWHDFARAPAVSLFYGVVFAMMGWAIHMVFQQHVELVFALTAGFLLVGPFLATGLYDASRTLALGRRPHLADTLVAWRANLGAFSLFALALTILMLIWARASLVTFALFFSSGMPTLKGFLQQIVSLQHLDFLLTYFAVGLAFAVIAFAVSVVSVPMMLDRGTDTVVAALTSARALLTQTAPLLLWAVMIVVIVGLGFATLFIGLVVAVPVIGHATWHAYRDLVGERSGTADSVMPSVAPRDAPAEPHVNAGHAAR